MSEECCSIPCVAPAKHEAITAEHLADFIDVFKRRLEKQTRALFPERYATSEEESLLQELEQLREEEMTLLEEVRKIQGKRDVAEWEAGEREELSHIREETDIYFSFSVLRDSSPVSTTRSDLRRQESIRRAEARKAKAERNERKSKRKSKLVKREEVRIHMTLLDGKWSKPAVPMEDVVWEEKKDWPQ